MDDQKELSPAQRGLGDMGAAEFRRGARRVADRVADYLDLAPAERAWPRLVEAATLSGMKRNADRIMPELSRAFFEGGADRFLYKGTNRRWEGVLSEEDLALYAPAIERTLSPDAAAWLEGGQLGQTAATTR